MGNFIPLERICEEFDFILLDTSALINFLEAKSSTSLKLKDRISCKKSEIDSCIFFNKYLKQKGMFYLTERVSEEFECPKNKTFEEVLPYSNRSKSSKKERVYFGKICSAMKERKKLLKNFKKENKIINLDIFENYTYNQIYRRNKPLKKIKRLTETDYDLLITAAVFSVSRGNTSLISNDFSILYAYQDLIKNERFNSSKYGFFIRKKENTFSRGIV